MTAANTEDIRAEVRKICAEVLPVGWRGLGGLEVAERTPFLDKWRATLVEHRLLVPGWPEQFGGRAARVDEQVAIAEELIRRGLPALPHHNDAYGVSLLGPTLLEWGTEQQRERFLGPTVDGTIRWAQGYSESDAGSDLFALRTRAERTSAGWRINGHKIWQTAGLSANWLFALVRTDAEAPRAKGLSFMLLPLTLDGVDVRGIKNV
ncbi:MAG: acyl-CoA dehydrogenase family protein, partial [Acidimicrobiales bacterium]